VRTCVCNPAALKAAEELHVRSKVLNFGGMRVDAARWSIRSTSSSGTSAMSKQSVLTSSVSMLSGRAVVRSGT
jgi:hypothetical protein